MSAYQEVCYQQQKEIEKLKKVKSILNFIPFSKRLQVTVMEQLENVSDFQMYLYRQDDVRELYYLYEGYLSEVASIFQKNGVTHPFDVAEVYSDAIYQGIFSKSGQFQFQDSFYDNNLFLLFAPRIMSGTGVCRHVSALFNDFSDNFSFTAPEVYGFSAFPWQTKKKAFKKSIGHAINIIEWKGKSIGLDLTNRDVYFFTGSKRLEDEAKSMVYYVDCFTTISALEQARILEGPHWKIEEYQEEKESLTSIDKASLFKELRALQQQSRPQLERISEIEEKYTEPQMKEKKVFMKKY